MVSPFVLTWNVKMQFISQLQKRLPTQKKNILKYNVIVIKVIGKTNRDSGSTCSKSIKMYFYLRGKESISTIQSAARIHYNKNINRISIHELEKRLRLTFFIQTSF